jgi:succinate dehydrogenase / fumarate reductase membrane anchor subunit
MSLRSPLGRVLGLGAAKNGVHHWWVQRVSAVGLVILGLWFVISLLCLGQLDYDTVRTWLASPVNAALLVLLVVTSFYHSQLGVQVVLEDYVKSGKVIALVASQFVHLALGTVAVIAVLRVAFGSAA